MFGAHTKTHHSRQYPVSPQSESIPQQDKESRPNVGVVEEGEEEEDGEEGHV